MKIAVIILSSVIVLLLVQVIPSIGRVERGVLLESYASDHNGFLKEPLVKVSDPTESSRRLVEFTKNEYLNKEIVKVTENVYVAIGWTLANSILIVGESGLIIVDTTERYDAMREIMKKFREISDKPVKAVIFTHFHGDHHRGTLAVIEDEQHLCPQASIEIYAHEMTKDLILDGIYHADIGTIRAARQFGVPLAKADAQTGAGIGPKSAFDSSRKSLLIIPTVTFTNRATYQIAGLIVELIHTPGETDDQITVWLPRKRVALPGDNIYNTFPNLYAIRGTPARDAQKWYKSLDLLHSLNPKYLIGSHTRPIVGEDEVRNTLLVYRDGIKYVHDQTVRLINKGLFPGEIVERVKLPDGLAKHSFLQEHYGTVEWSVKGVFTNYLGWFSGDPKDLHHMSNSDRAVRLIKLITKAQSKDDCAVEILLQEAEYLHRQSFNQYKSIGKHDIKDNKWALELIDFVLALEGIDSYYVQAARQIKISILRALGIEQVSPNGRHYYLTYAMEMEKGNASVVRSRKARAHTIKSSPTDHVLGWLCLRVKGLQCQYKSITIGLTFSDEGKQYGLNLRNSVCDVFDPIPADGKTDLSLITTAQLFKNIIAEETDLIEEISRKTVHVSNGDIESYKEFFACLDPIYSD